VMGGKRGVDAFEVLHDGRTHVHVLEEPDSVGCHWSSSLSVDRGVAISLNPNERRCDYLSGSRDIEMSLLGWRRMVTKPPGPKAGPLLKEWRWRRPGGPVGPAVGVGGCPPRLRPLARRRCAPRPAGMRQLRGPR